ncbi:uncharacterized protein LOC107272917 isoform X1 [Cephus cinctus]|uniref:Uncharacterized protein LOC107272917 isoform X1 n=1 Tax=Cephus cinctus TaxID=211228 RepID=A0AAJ7RT68_CEPCN|nr:uncharacterized protein LOC107272917 isoform X1 [Cephus cinctus]XP_024945991.1 uncharacterized protein LOC107272917 isoform X1 [Cephus cinctus]
MILKIGTVYLESNPTSTPAYLKTTRDTMNSVRRLSISALIQILWDCLKVMNYKRNSRMAFSLSIAISPESIIVPIVSCILGFPLLALLVICCLRRRAKLARERARRRNCDMDHGALSLVRFSPVHRLASKEDLAGVDRNRTISLRSERGSRAFPSLELDTVVEERSDPEQSTALELSSPD